MKIYLNTFCLKAGVQKFSIYNIQLILCTLPKGRGSNFQLIMHNQFEYTFKVGDAKIFDVQLVIN